MSPEARDAVAPRADLSRRASSPRSSFTPGWLVLICLGCIPTLLWGTDSPVRWRWSNPQPHGGNVVDMAYAPALSLAVQVAERGQIYVSYDIDLWQPRDTFVTNDLRAVTFLGQRVVVTGENGLILYSDDALHFATGTLLDGSTSDWLEGVTASGNLLVAVGDSGAIYTSSSGSNWKKQNSGTNTWFRGVAAGAGNYVVVGEDGVILSSPNGTNWTKRTSTTSAHLNRVVYSPGRFTAVGEGGVTLSSTNAGTNWFAESTGATNDLQYVSTGGLDRLVDGTHEVRLQENQLWSNQLAASNAPPDWSYLSSIGRAGFFLIAGQTGMQSEGYQLTNEPYFWLTPYDSVRNWLWDITRLPSFYMAVGDLGTLMTSGDGVDWNIELPPAGVTNTTFLGVGGTTNLLVAVGDSGTIIYSPANYMQVIITNDTGTVTQTVSSLGVIWYRALPGPTNSLQGVAVISNSLFLVTGAKGTILSSLDGLTWLPRASPTTNLLSGVASAPGRVVAVGSQGTLITSPDAITWNTIKANTTNWIYRVRWSGGVFLAVGQNGLILSSPDGLSWTNRNSGSSSWLTDAAFVGNSWFVTGLGGTVLSSSNLVNWSAPGTLTRKPLYAAATDSSQLVVVGVEGVILRTQVVPDLTPVSYLDYSRIPASGSSPAYNVYLFGGQTDQRFTLLSDTNLVGSPWLNGAELEIFDGSGTLYYVESISGTNLPAAEFYRTALTP